MAIHASTLQAKYQESIMTSIAPELLVNLAAAMFLCLAEQGLISERQAVIQMRSELSSLGIRSSQINSYSGKGITEIIENSGGCEELTKESPFISDS